MSENNLPVIQPLFQHRIWQKMSPGGGRGKNERLAAVIGELRHDDGRFHMEGGSWTNDISWVRGYDSLLIPIGIRKRRITGARPRARRAADGPPRVPQRPVSSADRGDELLSLLGAGRVDRFRAELARRTTEGVTTTSDEQTMNAIDFGWC